jgi:hypothetical protein
MEVLLSRLIYLYLYSQFVKAHPSSSASQRIEQTTSSQEFVREIAAIIEGCVMLRMNGTWRS